MKLTKAQSDALAWHDGDWEYRRARREPRADVTRRLRDLGLLVRNNTAQRWAAPTYDLTDEGRMSICRARGHLMPPAKPGQVDGCPRCGVVRKVGADGRASYCFETLDRG